MQGQMQGKLESIYYVKPVDNSRLVPLGNPREPRQFLLSALCGVMLLGAALFAARGRFESLEIGYRIERLDRERVLALEVNRKLQLEEASLGDPLRIDWIARNELGMKTLAPHQIFQADSAAAPALVASRAARPTAPINARAQ